MSDEKVKKVYCISYARVSMGELQHNTIPDQWELIRKYADEAGHTIVQEFCDQCSGTELERPGLNNVFEEIRQRHETDNKISFLLIKKMNRLARDIGVYAKIDEFLKEYGVAVIPVNNPEAGDIQKKQEILDSEKEREKTSRGTRDRALTRQSEGYHHGKPPFGYRFENRGEHSELVIVENEARKVREIFTLFIEGKSYTEILTLFPELKTINQIKRILTRPMYIGMVKSASNWVQGKHQSIVTEEPFINAGTIISDLSRKAVTRKDRRNKNAMDSGLFLKGSLYCSECYKLLEYSPTTKLEKTYRYYRCKDNHVRGRVEVINKTFDELMSQFRMDADTYKNEYWVQIDDCYAKTQDIYSNVKMHLVTIKILEEALELAISSKSQRKDPEGLEKYRVGIREKKDKITCLNKQILSLIVKYEEAVAKLRLPLNSIIAMEKIIQKKKDFIKTSFPNGFLFDNTNLTIIGQPASSISSLGTFNLKWKLLTETNKEFGRKLIWILNCKQFILQKDKINSFLKKYNKKY